uniref:Uncharacterized protein n=1 Tax=Ralstonia solanacearum TaxID=305 RepID=A0A0S4XBN0_RALSL|nr:protein of unknown function [Ralstonia solanacearum]
MVASLGAAPGEQRNQRGGFQVMIDRQLAIRALPPLATALVGVPEKLDIHYIDWFG